MVPPTGPIPAHLLGNPWAQEWGNIYDLVAPAGEARGYDLTERLRAQKMDARAIVRNGRGLLHVARLRAAAGDLLGALAVHQARRSRRRLPRQRVGRSTTSDDLRIKMCIQVNEDDFITVHHELGHNFYQRAYRQQPFLFMNSANDGFHEAIGDTIALSVTPAYLKQIGLIDAVPPATGDTGLLLHQALDKIAFLPFGLLIDQWRWGVFSGEITPARLQQGVVGPADDSTRASAAPVRAQRGGLRSRREVPRAGELPVHALLPRAHPPVPVPPRAVRGGRAARAAAPLLDLRQQGGGRAAAAHAGDGREPPWPDALEALTGSGRWTPPRSSTTSRR